MKYRVTNAEGKCPTIVEADSPKEAAEEWAEFWLNDLDSCEVVVSIRFKVTTEEARSKCTAKEITT